MDQWASRGGRVKVDSQTWVRFQPFGLKLKLPNLIEQIDWVQADITDLGGLDSLFDGIEYVYHCAALISFDPKDFKILERTNVESTGNVVNLSLKHSIKKLCYVSSIAAIGPSIKGKESTEENEWNEAKASVYGITKYEAELEVWRGSQEGLSIVIINPGVVIGPGFWKSGSGTFCALRPPGVSAQFVQAVGCPAHTGCRRRQGSVGGPGLHTLP